jgi:uncharacterized protein YodC (DUF2158 family)
MSVNQDIPPEPRKVAPGDIVQVKGSIGPKMTVVGGDPDRSTHVECVYWDTSRAECNRFESVYVHRDSLAYFGEPVPTPNAELSREPRGTVSVHAKTVRTAIRNGRMLIERRADWATVHQCFEVLAEEVIAQTGISR